MRKIPIPDGNGYINVLKQLDNMLAMCDPTPTEYKRTYKFNPVHTTLKILRQIQEENHMSMAGLAVADDLDMKLTVYGVWTDINTGLRFFDYDYDYTEL